MHSRAPLGIVSLLVAALLGPLAACSGDSSDEDPSPSPSSTADASASSTPSAPSEPTTPTETEPTEPGVTPAAGPEIGASYLDDPVLRVRLPDDLEWRVQPGGDNASANTADGAFVDIGVRAVAVVPGDDIDDYADRTVARDSPLFPALERAEDREVAGVQGYVAEGTGDGKFSYVFGAVNGDAQVDVTFSFPRDDAQARAWIESVLASAEWL